MARLAKLIGTIVLVIWQLPQVLLGFVVRLLTMAKYNKDASKEYDRKIFNWRFKSGLSLSPYYIMVNKYASPDTIKHEKGHSIQSMYLGPLYLIVIGIPSIIWAGLIYKHTDKSYYWFYTELWANKLGGAI